jgi:heme O synthase-like polyprenyltransferase
MLISPFPHLPQFGILVTLLLLALLVIVELLSQERKAALRGFFLASITVLVIAFVFIIIHRLESVL